ncbi:hypothetical protein [Noviherbaspirillum denitrificans]|uniref:Uncharacterized protein n=1 Tax=Noviherbaspirillum denitrificans TaxID=1968433 RepID=A0A254TBM9_9BURK|nr:hypothetical protein [Noviherbaspirillum denitrificans]OWW20059.1 hypothetical protein AYR66_11710 [Noviherbaspirillum denitrificans]
MAAAIPDKGGTKAPHNIEPKQAPKESPKKAKGNAAATQMPKETRTAIDSYFGKVPNKAHAKWPGHVLHRPPHGPKSVTGQVPAPFPSGKDLHAKAGMPPPGISKTPPPFIQSPFDMLKWPKTDQGHSNAETPPEKTVPVAIPESVRVQDGKFIVDYQKQVLKLPGSDLPSLARDNAPVAPGLHAAQVINPPPGIPAGGVRDGNTANLAENCGPKQPDRDDRQVTRPNDRTAEVKPVGRTDSGSGTAPVTPLGKECDGNDAFPSASVDKAAAGGLSSGSRTHHAAADTGIGKTDNSREWAASGGKADCNNSKQAGADAKGHRPARDDNGNTRATPQRDGPVQGKTGSVPELEPPREQIPIPRVDSGSVATGKDGIVHTRAESGLPHLPGGVPVAPWKNAHAAPDNFFHAPPAGKEGLMMPTAAYDNTVTNKIKAKSKTRAKVPDEQENDIPRQGSPYAMFDPKIIPVQPLAQDRSDPDAYDDFKSGELEALSHGSVGWGGLAVAHLAQGEVEGLPSSYVPNGS